VEIETDKANFEVTAPVDGIQVIDGAPGARFLQVLKEKVENVECPSQSS
jgi:pyruvate/2-oxoglutarate dehydrogenase complex dihydrolipoamide acyltransferase (E2) component